MNFTLHLKRDKEIITNQCKSYEYLDLWLLFSLPWFRCTTNVFFKYSCDYVEPSFLEDDESMRFHGHMLLHSVVSAPNDQNQHDLL